MGEPLERPEPGSGSSDPEAQHRGAKEGQRILAARLEPWLIDVGSWAFGGLLVFTAAFTAALTTVDRFDGAVLVSMTAFACALPLQVAGICLARLVKDVQAVGMIDELTMQSAKNAGYLDVEAYVPPAAEWKSLRARRSSAALRYSLVIAAVCVALTSIGLVAALWYVAWWIGVVALAVIVLSGALISWTISLPGTESSRGQTGR